ncbi:MAG: peptide-methionine (S)-S-oxide reductase, partial [Planctomycetes bacterium]|nr:peptide-methionine (S)-S-oxide reductase [Planctomycetota bacterium]
PRVVSYEALARLFFEIHDPTQLDRQGPDIGSQYRSEIYYGNQEEKEIAERLVGLLKDKGYEVKTRLTPVSQFWPAENYHQDYYSRNGKQPYCHSRVERF